MLSLVWQDYSPFRTQHQDDPVVSIIDSHQYIRVDDLQNVGENDARYTAKVKEIVKDLRKAILLSREQTERERDEPTKIGLSTIDEADEMGLLEAAAEVDELMPELQQSASALKEGLESLTDSINEQPAPENATPKKLLVWSRSIAETTAEDVAAIREQAKAIRREWDIVCDASSRYISFMKDLPDGNQKSDSMNGFEATLLSLRQSLQTPVSKIEMTSMARILKTLSPRLRPLASSLESVFSLFEDRSDKVDELVAQLRAE